MSYFNYVTLPYRITVIISEFDSDDVGSIPAKETKINNNGKIRIQ